jgi:translation initiation factor eIF-2B subunit beta
MCAHRQIHGSFACAKKTAEVMRLLITTQRHPDAASLIEDVRTVGTKLQAAKPVGECNLVPLEVLAE